MKATEFHKPEPLVVRKRPAPNANIEHQLRFHSTTKKRAKTPRIAKPTQSDEDEAMEVMMNVAVQICGICMKEDDSSTTVGAETVDWIQCEQCGLWVHLARSNASIENEYICSNCI